MSPFRTVTISVNRACRMRVNKVIAIKSLDGDSMKYNNVLVIDQNG